MPINIIGTNYIGIGLPTNDQNELIRVLVIPNDPRNPILRSFYGVVQLSSGQKQIKIAILMLKDELCAILVRV